MSELLPKFVDTDLPAIDEAYNRLSETFASHRTLPIEYRLYNLKQLAFLIQDNEAKIQATLKADLDKAGFDTLVGDVWPIIGEIDHAIKRLPEWMKDDKATRDATAMFKLTRPHVVKQPKGVSLIIGAWNYPWQLTLSPLVGAIAAGCPAIIKASEHSPASAALIAELLPRYLDPDGYAVVNGGPEQATHLLKKRWGHIVYTGSGTVGKIVAEAAAKTLTPTTLELGGKSPVIIAPDADLAIAARRMISMKVLNSGQMCVSPDYVLCPKDLVDKFVDVVIKTLDEFFPHGSDRSALADHPQASCLRNSRDYERIEAAVEYAATTGKLVYRGEADKARRRMGINVVKLNKGGEGEDGILAKEEIFGPVLPIIPVDDVDAAIRYVNARPTPLALYVCSTGRAIFDRVVRETLSGSAIWNDFSLVPVARTLPFGGVGESGWGQYHGYDGFLTFSHRKGVIEVPLWMEFAQKSRYPPSLTEKGQRMMRAVLAPRISFSRPESVEHERQIIARRRARRQLYLGLIIVALGAWIGVSTRNGRLAMLLAGLRSKLGF